ncbi:hypothetical protein ACLOJK_010626 [Asimina triloba]
MEVFGSVALYSSVTSGSAVSPRSIVRVDNCRHRGRWSERRLDGEQPFICDLPRVGEASSLDSSMKTANSKSRAGTKQEFTGFNLQQKTTVVSLLSLIGESYCCCRLLLRSKSIIREIPSTLPSDPPSPCINLVIAPSATLQCDHLLVMAAKFQPSNLKRMISMAHKQRPHTSFHAVVCSPITRLALSLEKPISTNRLPSPLTITTTIMDLSDPTIDTTFFNDQQLA